jgi:hypothetical protein
MTNGSESTNTNIPLEKLAKLFVLAVFRNGEIEEVHGGKSCPTCHGHSEYSHISQDEMRDIMRDAVNKVYTLFKIANEEPDQFFSRIQELLYSYRRLMGNNDQWDEPQIDSDIMLFRKSLGLPRN